MKKKFVLGAVLLVAALAPLSAYAANNLVSSTAESKAVLKPGTVVGKEQSGKVSASASAIPAAATGQKKGSSTATGQSTLKPGAAAENSIGFAGGLPPVEVLMQMIEQMKSNTSKSGKDTVVVINASESGQEKLTISLNDSTEKIVKQIQKKFKDVKPLSATAIPAEQK